MKTQRKMLTICLISALGLSFSTQAAPLLSQDGGAQSSATIENVNAWLEIDTLAFEQNIATLEKLLDGKSKICAVVKADAYGNGLDLLMPSIMKMNVPCLAITSNEEARIIRAHGYQGQVVRLADFGAFVNILPGKDGLVHISQITEERVKNVSDHLSVGDTVKVKVLEVDRQGRIRLSIKEAKDPEVVAEAPAEAPARAEAAAPAATNNDEKPAE